MSDATQKVGTTKPAPMPFDVARVRRFWMKVTRPGESECWEWTGAHNRNGYGTFRVGGAGTSPAQAHRYSYELLVGPIPPGLSLDHLCRNRGCVNPSHLEPVTGRVNTLRGVSFAAENAAKTHCLRGHEFTPENIIPRAKARQCRACVRLLSTSSAP